MRLGEGAAGALAVVLLSSSCCANLVLEASSSTGLEVREGESTSLVCASSSPWFVCMWTGPGGLALHRGQGDLHQEEHVSGHNVTASPDHRECRLNINGVRGSEAGSYKCVLTDTKLETADQSFEVVVTGVWLSFLQPLLLILLVLLLLIPTCCGICFLVAKRRRRETHYEVHLEETKEGLLKQSEDLLDPKQQTGLLRQMENGLGHNLRQQLIPSTSSSSIAGSSPSPRPGMPIDYKETRFGAKTPGLDEPDKHDDYINFEEIKVEDQEEQKTEVKTNGHGGKGRVVLFSEETIITVEETEETTISFMRQRSKDLSCTTEEKDINDIVDPNCNLSHEQVKKIFADLRDQDENITKETFSTTLMTCFPNYDMEENKKKLENIFDRLDSNSSGLISFRQFMLVTIALSSVALEDKLIRIFRLIDNNNDGVLTYDEFEDVIQDILVLKEEGKLATSLVESSFTESTFRDMGMNSNGNIVLKDFVEACSRKNFSLIDYIENFRNGLFVVVRTEETIINVEETETTTITFMRQKSVDQSCTTGAADIEDIVDPSCDLSPEEVKKTFADLRNQEESITQYTFVNTMMAFFPKFNMEENRRRLQKLFDRLDSNSSGLISFRQFMLVAIAFSNVSLEDKLVRIFRLIDNNDDGELTYEEFEDVVQDILVLKEERKLSTSLVESRFSENTFRDMGMNYRGNIVLRDFVDACAQNKFILINYIENFRDGFQSS